MATSGSFETSVVDRSDYSSSTYPNRIKVSWVSTQNVSSNSSTINWTIVPVGGTGNHFGAFSRFKVVLGGNTIYSRTETLWGRADGIWGTSFDYDTGALTGTQVTLSGSFTVPHNSDGTATLTGSAECLIFLDYRFYSTPNSTRTGYSVDLPTISRASNVSCGSGVIGSTLNITINKSSSSYTHTLRYSFGSASGTIVSQTSASSYSWSVPSSLANELPSSSSGTGTLYCDTYSGSTKVGTTSCTLNLSISSSSGSTSIRSFDSDSSTYVKDKDSVTWTAVVSVPTGASITKCVFSGPNLSKTFTSSSTSYSATSSTLTSTGTKTYTVTVTDSRGNTASASGSISVVSAGSASIGVTTTKSGTSATHKINASMSTYADSATIYGYYKLSSSSTYTSFYSKTIYSSSSLTYTQSGLDENKSYDFKFTISDDLGNTATTYTSTIGDSDKVAINIAPEDNGVALGKKSSNSGEFECAYPAKFISDIFVGSNIQVKDEYDNYVALDLKSLVGDSSSEEEDTIADYVVESGMSGIWTYRKWNSGIAECWGVYTDSICIDEINQEGFYYSQPIYIYYPFTFSGTPAVTISGGTGARISFPATGEYRSDRVKFWIACLYQDGATVNITVSIHAYGMY